MDTTVTLVENKTETFNEQLKELNEYTNLVNVPQSCGTLALLGFSKSKEVLVDHDGKGKHTPPIKVYTYLSTIFFLSQ